MTPKLTPKMTPNQSLTTKHHPKTLRKGNPRTLPEQRTKENSERSQTLQLTIRRCLICIEKISGGKSQPSPAPVENKGPSTSNSALRSREEQGTLSFQEEWQEIEPLPAPVETQEPSTPSQRSRNRRRRRRRTREPRPRRPPTPTQLSQAQESRQDQRDQHEN